MSCGKACFVTSTFASKYSGKMDDSCTDNDNIPKEIDQISDWLPLNFKCMNLEVGRFLKAPGNSQSTVVLSTGHKKGEM